MATWTYGCKRVVVEAGVVVESDCPALAAVGAKADAKRLRACGWKKAKAAVQYDAFGRRFRGGEVERE